MLAFIVGCVLLLVACFLPVVGQQFIPVKAGRILANTVILIAAFMFLVWSTSLYVGPNEGGLITKKFGNSLKEGHIIAVHGERGVQASILSPGWSFGWWPWLYNLQAVPNIEIREGQLGIVTAMDGKPLPDGDVYAPAWSSPNEMVDAATFLTAGNGCKGPQITVLPPGQYRYNPKLFDIQVRSCLDVPIGTVAVIKANAGVICTNTDVVTVNGIPLVPKGYRGIWNEPLTPNKYYLHPNAFQPTFVKTTKRVYSYTGIGTQEANATADRPQHDNSILVRSMDSFTFPIDVRVTVAILADNAPFVVARFGDPDAIPEKDGFDILETRAILPSIRAFLRNAAQSQGALQFVKSRSEVEKDTFNKFKIEMAKDKIEVEAVYLADIRLDASEEGKKLLATQTDKEIAVQQQETYKQQVLAENERANRVKAQEAADQQKNIQESQASIQVSANKAEAAINLARGDAAAYKAKVEALGGVENFTRLEIARMMFDAVRSSWKGEVPQILLMGGGKQGGESMLSDIMSGVFARQLSEAGKAQAAPKPGNQP